MLKSFRDPLIRQENEAERIQQLQIEEFLRVNDIDILQCQEININEDTFSECNLITSSYNIITNNSSNKYGTASIVKNEYSIENITVDTNGRVLIFDIENITFGNFYLPSGTYQDQVGKIIVPKLSPNY